MFFGGVVPLMISAKNSKAERRAGRRTVDYM